MGSAYADTIVGSAGDEFFELSGGADSIDGGGGNDTLSFAGASSGVTYVAATGAVTGAGYTGAIVTGVEAVIGSGFGDNITMTVADDTVSAGGWQDVVFGGCGNDLLSGGADSDTIDGGSGNDTIDGGLGADVLAGGAGEDWLDYSRSASAVSVDLRSNAVSGGDAQGDTVSGFEHIVGSAVAGNLVGNSGNNVIDFGTANAVLGKSGNDTLRGQSSTGIGVLGGHGDDTYIWRNEVPQGAFGFRYGEARWMSGNIINLSTGNDTLVIEGSARVLGATSYASYSGGSIAWWNVDQNIVSFDNGGAVLINPLIENVRYLDTDYSFNDFLKLAFEEGGLSASAAQAEVNAYVSVFNSNLAAATTVVAEDPVILDLDGDGVEIVDLFDGSARFDIAGDGVRRQTAWAGSDDALLAMDLDGNGAIDDVTELLSERFGGGHFIDGEAALASLDDNGDGRLDAADSRFMELLLWQDANQEGESGEGELSDLESRGVVSIDLGWTRADWTDGTSEMIAEESFRWSDGREGAIADVGFGYVSNIGATASVDGDGFLRLDPALRMTDEAADPVEPQVSAPDAGSGMAEVDGVRVPVAGTSAEAPLEGAGSPGAEEVEREAGIEEDEGSATPWESNHGDGLDAAIEAQASMLISAMSLDPDHVETAGGAGEIADPAGAYRSGEDDEERAVAA